MLAQFSETAARDRRLEAGRMLLELRHRKEDEGEDWWLFVKHNIHHCSRRDIERLIALARDDDPE
jgi:hypothetical protein